MSKVGGEGRGDASGQGFVRIEHKGPCDFPNHECPAESAAVWNTCCMEHERVLAGKPTFLATTVASPQVSGGEMATLVAELRKIESIRGAIGGTPEIAKMYRDACVEFVRHPILLAMSASQEIKS